VAVGQIDIPTIDVTSINTGVTIPDKGTVLLGGQRVSTELEVETGVPVLSKLPIINRFFTNRAQIKSERTLLILVKPTIIIQNEEEENAYPGLLDRLNDPFR
jgi:type II secretory pathway component GspD/PulD (secretin)